MTLSEILNTNEINWIMDKAQAEKPYDDADYTEYSFNGNLPSRMANKIRSIMDSFYKKDSTYVIRESDEKTFEKVLTIKFGNKMSNQHKVMFFYTKEVVND